MPPVFLDTNVLLRHVLQDHDDMSPRARAYLERIENGEIEVLTADTVIFETVFILHRQYGRSKEGIRDAIMPLIELPGVVLPGKRRYRRVFDLFVETNLPFADAYHTALMEQLGIEEIATFDRDFDRIPGIRRATL
jgi:predicted nucleic acid-binding protein